jgi:hypothetical protein
VTVGGQALAAGGTTMQPQSGTDTYMNTGTSAARLLVLSVAPAAAASPPAAPAQASATPPSAPPTGGGGEANFVRRLGDG